VRYRHWAFFINLTSRHDTLEPLTRESPDAPRRAPPPTVGHRHGSSVGARSRARRWASAICAGVIRCAIASRASMNLPRVSLEAPATARLNHMLASVSSCDTPSPREYLTPRLYCAAAFPHAAARQYHRTA
jgi:hypothetical protein